MAQRISGVDRRSGAAACEPQVWLNSVNPKNKAALAEWIKNSKVELLQVNGQRKYGGPPPGWFGEAPPLGSEIFIGNLPQEVYEDLLIPLFQSVGKLYEFRLMMTFSGLNRGFAYARYCTRRMAEQAIDQLCGFEIKPGFKILVCRSTEKSELALDGLLGFLTKATLEGILGKMTIGVCSVSLYASPSSDAKNLAIVKYNSHRAAALAKKSLCEGVQVLYGCPFTVDWLPHSLKQKAQAGTLAKPNLYLPQKVQENTISQKTVAPSAIQCLDLLCEKVKLGQPLYKIKFLSLGTCGWLRFWYLVLIPKHGVPFTGYSWLLGDQLIPTEKYQQAKEMVAMHILNELGYIFD
ncbi:dead end protein homolog 1-like [Bufo gargarizans]|uniref:dead end protein homolog 1-like n=1 Tax=Bufo gargarizans TaxID=30331 RepID=UPI001CF54378|nr:dead end protein homolog 1-like [Bufo gargarizans]